MVKEKGEEMREIKARAWGGDEFIYLSTNKDGIYVCGSFKTYQLCIGLEDKNGKDWYHKDIGEFDNGDRFIIKCENWLEFYVEWIGEPKCEDQSRDLYRIEKAKKTGNIHENPELLK